MTDGPMPPPPDVMAPPMPSGEESLDIERTDVDPVVGLNHTVRVLQETVAELSGKAGMYSGAHAQLQVAMARLKRDHAAEVDEWAVERQALLEQVARLTADAMKPAPGVKPSVKRRREHVADDKAAEQRAPEPAPAEPAPAEPSVVAE